MGLRNRLKEGKNEGGVYVEGWKKRTMKEENDPEMEEGKEKNENGCLCFVFARFYRR